MAQSETGRTAVLVCPACTLRQRSDATGSASLRCARCLAPLVRPRPHARQRTAALALTAAILYVPANVLPIMEMTWLGPSSEITVWSGCVALWHDGMTGVAIIVFLASILIPILKLMGLFVLTTTTPRDRGGRGRAIVYRLLESLGRWAMLDVFLVAIMVALVKLGDIARVEPRVGVFYFAAVVVSTTMATASFDASSLWKTERPGA